MRTGERGFTLLELLVCMAILALVSASVVGSFAALARNANAGAARDAAAMAAENALTRARAAIAYANAPAADGPALLADRSWGLVPGQTRYVAGARLRAGTCDAARAPVLQLPVVTSYDQRSERFSATVTYPRHPCAAAADGSFAGDDAATVTLAQTLPPSAYPPGQAVHRDIAPPARM